MPAHYDAVWPIGTRLYGFRQDDRYGVISCTGRVICECTLPALYVGFREVTPAAVLDHVVVLGLGNAPRLQQVLGRPCYADLLRAEEVTPQLWRANLLRHVLPSGELVRIRPARYTETMPVGGQEAETAAAQDRVLVLGEGGDLRTLTYRECAAGAPAPEQPTLPAAPVPNGEQAERLAARQQPRALFEDRQIAPFAYDVEPEMVFDWLPYDVLRLPADCLRRCRAHIQGHLEGDDPQLEARTWQLIYLAWLAANGHVQGCPDGLDWEVSEQFVFGDGPFDNLPLGELLDDYGLWNLAPWLRDNGRFL